MDHNTRKRAGVISVLRARWSLWGTWQAPVKELFLNSPPEPPRASCARFAEQYAPG